MLVETSSENPKGRAPVMVQYADEEDQSFIREVIRARLELDKGPDGMVTITFCINGRRKTYTVRCVVREEDDEDTPDVAFGTKVCEDISRGSPGHNPDPSAIQPPGMLAVCCISLG